LNFMRGLKGKTAIVTGAGSGIGRAIALRLAAEGVTVGVFDVNPNGASETVAAIEAAGGKAAARTCDITDYAAVTAAVAAFEAGAGAGTDILVNTAGWDTPMPFLKTDEAFWKKVTAINWFGPLHMTHAVAQGMAARKSGRIVNIASDAGRVGSTGEVVYSGCKGATIAFAKALARELARSRVTINTICPGPTDTPAMTAFVGTGEQGQKIRDAMVKGVPLGRIGVPDDYPGLVAFLASDDAAFMTGQTISVSGGLTMHG
jgi:2-hydroxycyclohexanecarboxyl-CoA dehydrogenase